MRLPNRKQVRCSLVLIAVQVVVYSLFVLRFLPLKRNAASSSSSLIDYDFGANSSSDRIDTELYFNGELNIVETGSEEECARNFLTNYSKYCESAIVPSPQVIREHLRSNENLRNKKLCPCLPQNLTGKVNLNMTSTRLTSDVFQGLVPGGHWSPTWCIPRQRIAIIIPFRDRASHLDLFLQVFHPFLQKQLHSYSIFVIEQNEPIVFNKACLMNVGFREVVNRWSSHRAFDCFIFHDVDSLPQDDRNIYGCYKVPKHVAAYFDKLGYRLIYYKMFGGATGFTRKQFEASNGYSNEYWGWGGEDDDMEKRVAAANLTFLRYPKCVSRYTMIKHERDQNNPRNKWAAAGWYYRPEVYKRDGLNSLSYTLVGYEERLLYTKIVVNLPSTTPQKKIITTAAAPKTTTTTNSTHPKTTTTTTKPKTTTTTTTAKPKTTTTTKTTEMRPAPIPTKEGLSTAPMAT